jgi:hypothetical protein
MEPFPLPFSHSHTPTSHLPPPTSTLHPPPSTLHPLLSRYYVADGTTAVEVFSEDATPSRVEVLEALQPIVIAGWAQIAGTLNFMSGSAEWTWPPQRIWWSQVCWPLVGWLGGDWVVGWRAWARVRI